VSEDAGIEPRAVVTSTLACRDALTTGLDMMVMKLAGIRMIFPYIRTYFVYNSQISSKMYREGCNNSTNLPTTEVELNSLKIPRRKYYNP
jgi:hypothetical protein